MELFRERYTQCHKKGVISGLTPGYESPVNREEI